jgi:hypothetical protein
VEDILKGESWKVNKRRVVVKCEYVLGLLIDNKPWSEDDVRRRFFASEFTHPQKKMDVEQIIQYLNLDMCSNRQRRVSLD